MAVSGPVSAGWYLLSCGSLSQPQMSTQHLKPNPLLSLRLPPYNTMRARTQQLMGNTVPHVPLQTRPLCCLGDVHLA